MREKLSVKNVILVVLAVVLIGALEYIYVLKKQLQIPAVSLKPSEHGQSQSLNSITASQQAKNTESWKMLTNSALHFSVQYPSNWIVSTYGAPHPNPANNTPSLANPQYFQQPVYFQVSVYNCTVSDLISCMKDYFNNYQTSDATWKFDSTQIKKITTSSGLTGVFYDNQDKIVPEKIAMFAYPNNIESNTIMAVHMRSDEGPISVEQNDIFMKIIDSFRFTK